MKEVAKSLLDIKAVIVNDKERFTWASGIKSPIYTDNRMINSFPKERKAIEAMFASMIKETFPEVEMVIGTATAGISHAAYISDILELPMAYVRGSKKAHGRNNQIEGKVDKGIKAVVIEDLLSTGGSSLEAVNVLKEAGVEVLGVGAIFSYQLKKLGVNFANVKYSTLTNLNELLEVAAENGLIETQEIQLVKDFRDNL